MMEPIEWCFRHQAARRAGEGCVFCASETSTRDLLAENADIRRQLNELTATVQDVQRAHNELAESTLHLCDIVATLEEQLNEACAVIGALAAHVRPNEALLP